MQNVMGGMAKIMSGASNKMKNQGYQETMKRFMTEKERMNVLNEYVEDVMNGDEEQIEDDDVDKLINDMEHETIAKKQTFNLYLLYRTLYKCAIYIHSLLRFLLPHPLQ